MAQEVVTEESAVLELIRSGQSFLLSGGAGSGKTYSLIEVIKGVSAELPLASIACITFTNVAVAEIKSRAPFENLYVTTIHEFLWDTISRYQLDLKKSLSRLVENGSINIGDGVFDSQAVEQIEYREWLNIAKGVISHDELIKISVDMFEDNPMLAQIVADRFDYIFVDEYQDTFSEVVGILLERVRIAKRPNVIGFFGDSMQAIYDRSSPEDVKQHVLAGDIKEVIKSANRRNPTSVLGVINQLRDDDLTQQPSDDSSAPNYQKTGTVTFLYSTSDDYSIGSIKAHATFDDWDFNDSDKTKELYLVKKFIAKEAGFPQLMDVYVDDGIIKYKDAIKREIKTRNLTLDESGTFGSIIDTVNKSPTPAMQQYINQHPQLLEEARGYPYADFKKIRVDADLFMGSKKVSDFDDRDRGQRCDELISHLMGLQELVTLYESRQYNDFIKKTHYRINSIDDKDKLKLRVDTIVSMKDASINEVLEYAHESGLWPKDDKLLAFQQRYPYRWNRVVGIPYSEIINLYKYTENKTPYSTQHGVKGAEYDDVLVVLDNGGWSNYNFKNLFEGNGSESVRIRTQRMFYVCCSRARRNLVVFFSQPSAGALNQAKQWFGEDNVKEIS